EKSLLYIEKGILVGALCGATLALAELSVLDRFKHTSNALEFLTMFSKNYRGQELYVDSQAVIDKNLVTASAAGGLLFAKHVINYLNLFSDSNIESWYNYYLTGKPEYLMKLIS
ncbi:MAG: DJ-1/PfpI family protein, partial [Proteocatella sp.]